MKGAADTMFNIPGIESPLHVREAAPADRPQLVALINTAFSIEDFIGGTRTDDENLAEHMAKGSMAWVFVQCHCPARALPMTLQA